MLEFTKNTASSCKSAQRVKPLRPGYLSIPAVYFGFLCVGNAHTGAGYRLALAIAFCN